MKLVTYRSAGLERPGALLDDGGIVDLADLAPSLLGLIEAGPEAIAQARGRTQAPDRWARAPDDARLVSPLPRPPRMRDGALFLQHMEVALGRLAEAYAVREADPVAALAQLRASGRYDLKPIFRERIIYYTANHMDILGPEADIAWPAGSEWMDYELEWACVVGRTGRDIPRERAAEHILGFTIFNDWSARDIQRDVMETNLGPSAGKDFANSLGPCIRTRDSLPDPYALEMSARVNGETWSRGSTGTMHHSFEDAVVELSRGQTLHAGEVIGSGTVLSGCGFELGRRLAPGDVVELEVEGIGVLRNRLVRSSPSSSL